MQEEKLSQTESRMLVRWIEKKLKLKIGNVFYFWRMSPNEAVEGLMSDFGIKISEEDVRKAIKV